MRASRRSSLLWLASGPFADRDTLSRYICILSVQSGCECTCAQCGHVCGSVRSYRSSRSRWRGRERRGTEVSGREGRKEGGARPCMVREGRRELNSWVGNCRAEREEEGGWVTLLCDEVQCKDSRLFLCLPVLDVFSEAGGREQFACTALCLWYVTPSINAEISSSEGIILVKWNKTRTPLALAKVSQYPLIQSSFIRCQTQWHRVILKLQNTHDCFTIR